jgi:hypothetical protein
MEVVNELSRLAEKLNQESDAFTTRLASLNEKLNKLNLGVEVWLERSPLSDQLTAGNPMRDTNEQTLLGFAKTPDGWGLAVKDVRIERGYYENDLDCPWNCTYEVSQPKLLLKSSRQLRLKAASALPLLLEDIKEKAEQVLAQIEKARHLGDAF